jgi:uncharacterized protein (DUF2384 family)
MATKASRSAIDGTSTSSSTGRSAKVTVLQTAAFRQVQARTEFLIEALGSQAELARLLQVSTSQPSRWRAGEETPSPQHGRELLDLDHVMARAMLLWAPKTALLWLTGANSFLEGARPIDVLRTRGSSEVINALDSEMAGSFA